MNCRRLLARSWAATLLAMLQVCVGPAWAKVGLPVKIRMPANSPQAEARKVYAGVIEIDVGKAGVLDDFDVSGEGWSVTTIDRAAQGKHAQAGLVRVPFRAVPTDPDKPIRLSLTYNGRKVTRTFSIGPKKFAQRGRAYPTTVMNAGTVPAGAAVPVPTNAADEPSGPIIAGDGISLRFTGRFIYTRPDGRVVGVDNIWVEVMDSDPVTDETIWSGRTNEYGYFDSGAIEWDDCDIFGCDDPDLYVRFECDTSVVQVQDGTDILEPDYSWSTEDSIVEDFTGSQYNFGTIWPSDAGQFPALHIFNSINRAYRHVALNTMPSLEMDHLDVLWPEDDTYYDSYWEEIHVAPDREWEEGSHTHEYGHHFMYKYSGYVDPDYCNDWCDGDEPCTSGTDCENPGHCMGCPENEHDAVNEGFPHWLGDVVTNSYPEYYHFDDGTPFTAYGPRDVETPEWCCQDIQYHPGLETEGYFAALLRDISDSTQDYHGSSLGGAPYAYDLLCLGSFPVLNVMFLYGPTTPTEFMQSFLAEYPHYADSLWATAANVSPDFVNAVYPADTAPPGAVQVVASDTHPLGSFGPLPCISVKVWAADDDVSGVCDYSYRWGTDPAGAEPDKEADVVDFAKCPPEIHGGPYDMGSYYLSLRARDCTGKWSNEWATFGPFVVGECNNNGILDVCEIACDQSSADLACEISANFCNVTGCGTKQDCNLNLVPDECDIASGHSQDCNLDGIPDECQNVSHWAGGDGSWSTPAKWVEGQVPGTGYHVCIDDPAGVATVSYTQGTADVGILACRENLNIAGSVAPWISFRTTGASFVDGLFTFGGQNAQLKVENSLTLNNTFSWTRGTLTGAGTTFVNGGMRVVDAAVTLSGHRLILGGLSTAYSSGHQVALEYASRIEILSGATYNYAGDGGIFGGSTASVDNDGTIKKTSGTGTATIDTAFDNAGLVHVQSGTLAISRGNTSVGDYLGDPGTTLRFAGGTHNFLAGSSIVGDQITFTSGVSGNKTIKGTYQATSATNITGSEVTFDVSAHVVDYGDVLTITGGTLNFNTPFGGPIVFNSITMTSGAANFNSGDPVVTGTLTLTGTLKGPSGGLTVNGLLTWNPAGALISPGVISANGGMLVNAGSSEKTLNDRILNNAATATLLGGFTMQYAAAYNNLPGALTDIRADFGIGGGSINNDGIMVKSAGSGKASLGSKVTNRGTLEIKAGTMEFSTNYGYFYRQTSGQTILNGGNMSMATSGPIRIDGGILKGTGTITGNVVNLAGTTVPGLPAGQMNITGTYTQQSGATLQINLGGAAPGQYGRLACTGTVAITGSKLEIILFNGFEPQPGDVFEVLSASTISGTFATVLGTMTPGGHELKLFYTPTTLTLAVCPFPGDFDSDCDVDGDDLETFGSCASGPGIPHGGTSTCQGADQDDDSDVDQSDFAVFQRCLSGPDVLADPNCAK